MQAQAPDINRRGERTRTPNTHTHTHTEEDTENTNGSTLEPWKYQSTSILFVDGQDPSIHQHSKLTEYLPTRAHRRVAKRPTSRRLETAAETCNVAHMLLIRVKQSLVTIGLPGVPRFQGETALTARATEISQTPEANTVSQSANSHVSNTEWVPF